MLSRPLGPTLTPLRRRHLDQVLPIEEQCHDRPWSAGLFESELSQPTRRYLAAWDDGGPRGFGGSTGGGAPRVLGYGGVLLAVDELHVTNIAVDPQARRRSIGSHLLLALLEEGLQMGAVAATLEVRASNHGAQRLYSGFGFAPVGVRPGYYAATGEDAIIMWLYDLDGPAATARLQERRRALGLPVRPAAVAVEEVRG